MLYKMILKIFNVLRSLTFGSYSKSDVSREKKGLDYVAPNPILSIAEQNQKSYNSSALYSIEEDSVGDFSSLGNKTEKDYLRRDTIDRLIVTAGECERRRI
jgi:hypothetical protein